MDISAIHSIFIKHPRVSTDSRNVLNNSIFFALTGGSFNGNLFAEQALNNGALYAVVDDESVAKDSRFILVDDVLTSLQALALYHRNLFDIPVIGITGTNGKTTTKELLFHVLSQKYNVLATQGNFNNHIGVPLTLLNINQSHEIAIVEMGANHPGEIYDLCKIANPNFGFVTNVGLAHLEGFKTFENIVSTKSGLYQYVDEHRGICFINSDNKELMDFNSNIEFNYFKVGEHSNNTFSTLLKSVSPFLHLELVWPNEDVGNIDTQLVGSYNLSNIAAAAHIGRYFNLSKPEIQKGLSSYIPSNNRSQIIETTKNSIILDAYNANPTSLKAAIENFSLLSTQLNKVVIIGDMFELGQHSSVKHQEIVDYIINKIDMFAKVIIVGDHFSKTLHPKQIESFLNVENFKQSLKANPIEKAFVLVKGSRGMKMEQLLDRL
ncbi:MAG: UDP-N-acetylmuramoyl-tripeptide--D-alanyl-D-alanine ligase [Bacteroidales bacterium]|nr:UDP-N-acetylmuramoyl-tripeptide--D-alanyl-D-alanine ligase [Bacteroidales bacterium]